MRSGSWTSVEHRDLVGGGVGDGPPGVQQARQWLSSASGAVIDEGQQRMKPEGPLIVAVAPSLSEYAVISVASRSTMTGPASATGERWPQTVRRAAARAHV